MRPVMKGKKTLLLLTNAFLFKIAKSILEKMGCEVTDEIDASRFDFVIIDDAFLQSGMASLIESSQPQTPMIVLRRSRIIEKAKSARIRRPVPLAALN